MPATVAAPKTIIDPWQGAAILFGSSCFLLFYTSLPLLPFKGIETILLPAAAGILFGLWVPIRSYRILGLIPPLLSIQYACVVYAILGGTNAFASILYTFCIIVISVIAARHQFRTERPDHVRIAIPRLDFYLDLTFAIVVFGHLALVAFVVHEPYRTAFGRVPIVLIGYGILMALAWTRLFRPFFELCVEAKLRPHYRLVVDGPGAAKLPVHGPLIVIANHACMWDPLFLAKALPRPVTPMMTSLFYDRWYIKPLVKYVFGTIRVPDSRARREAPEIQDAIRALDEGKCLMLFPESYLRRKEEVPLRRFGRGIWEILKARPDTPVVCCWIEGAWGSYSSHWNGPPTKNKPKEGRRTISIGMSEPIRVPGDAIERHLATRIYLMNEVSAARRHLGLEPLPKFDLPAKDDEPEQPA
jgi:1-acyl-sn-glycerol-3-phosphate acyltransferase